MQTPAEPTLNRTARVAQFFALKRNLAILLIAILVIGAGEELWMRFIPKYLETLGASVFIIGLYDAIRTLLGAIYAYPGGVLVDRWGYRRAFMVFNFVSILGYSLVLLVPHWASVIAGMFLFLSWTCFSLPATLALVGESLAANRYSMAIGVQSVIRRLPLMISPIFGGILIDRFGVISGVRLGLFISIIFSAVTILVQTLLRDEKPGRNTAVERWGFWRSLLEFNTPIRRLLLSDILVRFCERIPYAWVVIFAMNYIGVSAKEVGVLTMVEVVTASLCIIPMSHLADKSEREPFVLVTFIMFTLFPITLLFSRSLPMLMIAFVIRGLKEFGDTARKGLIVAQVDPERRGQTIGAYYLVRDLVVSIGAILGAYLWSLGPGLNFLGAAAFGTAGTIFYFRSVRRLRAAAPPIVLYSRRGR
jgi:Arabinose efflux permease